MSAFSPIIFQASAERSTAARNVVVNWIDLANQKEWTRLQVDYTGNERFKAADGRITGVIVARLFFSQTLPKLAEEAYATSVEMLMCDTAIRNKMSRTERMVKHASFCSIIWLGLSQTVNLHTLPEVVVIKCLPSLIYFWLVQFGETPAFLITLNKTSPNKTASVAFTKILLHTISYLLLRLTHDQIQSLHYASSFPDIAHGLKKVHSHVEPLLSDLTDSELSDLASKVSLNLNAMAILLGQPHGLSMPTTDAQLRILNDRFRTGAPRDKSSFRLDYSGDVGCCWCGFGVQDGRVKGSKAVFASGCCAITTYCSKSCAKKHWTTHKSDCAIRKDRPRVE